jgi:hypothetical protein
MKASAVAKREMVPLEALYYEPDDLVLVPGWTCPADWTIAQRQEFILADRAKRRPPKSNTPRASANRTFSPERGHKAMATGLKAIDMSPVDSSMIKAIGHDPETSNLHVEFHGGAKYIYLGVPPEKHTALMQSESIGRHFNQNIRGAHEGVRQ